MTNETTQKLEQESNRWTNRRRIAWSSLFLAGLQTVCLIYILLFGDVQRITAVAQYGAIFMGLYAFCAGNIMAYIGTAAYSDVRLWKE